MTLVLFAFGLSFIPATLLLMFALVAGAEDRIPGPDSVIERIHPY